MHILMQGYKLSNEMIRWDPLKEIQILLIEGNVLLREGISGMLKKRADMHMVVTIGNGENIL